MDDVLLWLVTVRVYSWWLLRIASMCLGIRRVIMRLVIYKPRGSEMAPDQHILAKDYGDE